ncbi:MAG: type II secretion system F family protein [Nanoarchaeota archaeon]|nr:type II secretion system F family protein [Nanoarchaeota archaeon]
MNVNAGLFLDFVFALSILVAFISGDVLYYFLKLNFWIVFFAVFLIYLSAVFFIIRYRIDKRTETIEEELPDVLSLISANIKSGMTIEDAMMSSSRGKSLLKNELRNVGKEIMLGKETGIALKESAARFKSEKFEKTAGLISSGIKSGGSLAELLDQISRNLRNEEIMEKKINQTVLMYAIFIFTAFGLVAPVLLGLSVFLVKMIGDIITGVDVSSSGAGMSVISLSASPLTPEFITLFAVVFLLSGSVLTSLLVGQIMKGKTTFGIKYIPLLCILTLSLFFITKKVIFVMLQGLT